MEGCPTGVKNGVAFATPNEEEILKIHGHEIWLSKSGKWCTHIYINGERKIIRRKSRECVLDYLKDLYKTKDNILQEYKEDFSKYKEINVWNIKNAAYLVSPGGDIYSIYKNDWMSKQIYDKTKTYKGQYYVWLYTNDNEIKRFSVARLTAAMFIGLPPDDMEDPSVDHIDNDPLNNYYKNLRWVEHGDNSALRRNRGIGEMNSRAILTQEDVMHICNMFVRGGCSISDIANKYGVSDATIKSIYNKKTWDYVTAWYEFSPCVTG